MSLMTTELQAKDVMTGDPVCVPASMGIRGLARLFQEHEISGAPVVDAEGRVIGVVSQTDLIRRCAQGTDDIPPAFLFEVLSEQGVDADEASEVMPEPLVCVEEFMTPDPLTVGLHHSAIGVARQMHERGIHRVIVTDGERFPLGIITSMDLLVALSR